MNIKNVTFPDLHSDPKLGTWSNFIHQLRMFRSGMNFRIIKSECLYIGRIICPAAGQMYEPIK